MMLRTLARTTALLTVGLGLTLGLAAPASAQVVQSVQIGVGAFIPRGFDSRAAGDVLVEDLTGLDPLFFRIRDFTGGQVSGEWNVAFGHHIEFGAGVGYYQRSVPSIYRDLFNEDTGRDIQQTLRLRTVPITGVVRFLPFGKAGGLQPYVGVGVTALPFRYSEFGDFVDSTDGTIFRARFSTTGTAVGPVVLVGLRVPMGGDIYALTIESRQQWAVGKTGGAANGFLNDKIDLGGNNLTFGLLVRF
jgi:hypothetical protein